MNISSLKTPGVYINEIDAFPPSVAQVATAVPAFIGYTEKAPSPNIPTRISSLLEFQKLFGGAPQPESITLEIIDNLPTDNCTATESKFKLFNSLLLFYANGGGECYIVSIGTYKSAIAKADFTKDEGIPALEKFDEPTLILFPDAVNLSVADLAGVQKEALMQCQKLMDRFVIMDVVQDSAKKTFQNNDAFRDVIGTTALKYGASYYPNLVSNFPQSFRFLDIDKGLLPGDFKQFFPNNADLKSSIDNFKTLHDIDVIGLKTGWNTVVKPLPNLATTTDIMLAANLKKDWDLLKVFGKLNPLGTTAFKTYFEADIVGLSLKPFAQKLVNFKAAYEKLKKPGTVTAVDPLVFAPVLDDTHYTSGWGTISTLVAPILPAINEYDGKLSKEIPATVAPAPIVAIHDEPDFTKIQAELNKLHTQIINALDMAMGNIYNYELVQENNLIAQMPIYGNIVAKLSQSMNTVPPSGAIAGIYAQTDATRGVWKAPANVSINGIIGLTTEINDFDQEQMNVHETGKSINAIRKFTGKGFLVWGARTLDGNSNDWRYVNVRRLANMIEESVKKACMRYVFEPNVAQTWVNVKGMIENYLTTLWNDGALAGAKPEHAFFVAVGINQTMTAQDILEGRMIVKIGYAPSRPAEFIVLEFKQMLQKS
jgi:uncharacterized protein